MWFIAPGAIVVEWNVAGSSQGSAAMWDSYIRLGGTAGTNLQQSQCPTNAPGAGCYAAFLALHLTTNSNAYIEGVWVWLADHDVEGTAQVTIYSGRGVLSESQGPVWLIGTGCEYPSLSVKLTQTDDSAAEHHALYQYNLAGAANHYLGLPQTETVSNFPTHSYTLSHFTIAILSTQPSSPYPIQLCDSLPRPCLHQ